MATKKRGLGKGLDALLAGTSAGVPEKQSVSIEAPAEKSMSSEPNDGDLRHLPIEFLQRGQYQPRRDMDAEKLEELAESIKLQGVMQPIVVRPIANKKYEIIAGERRWRASQLAGLDKVPVIIRKVNDEATIAMALIENIQREDLNPMEEALALQRLQQEFSLTQQQVAEAVGKSRSTVANLLRLTTLNNQVRDMLQQGQLEMGHARALLGIDDSHKQIQAAKTVVAKKLSVRQTEALVKQLQQPRPSSSKATIDPSFANEINRLEHRLSDAICAPVNIQHSPKGKGKLVINYSNLDELDGILERICKDTH